MILFIKDLADFNNEKWSTFPEKIRDSLSLSLSKTNETSWLAKLKKKKKKKKNWRKINLKNLARFNVSTARLTVHFNLIFILYIKYFIYVGEAN